MAGRLGGVDEMEGDDGPGHLPVRIEAEAGMALGQSFGSNRWSIWQYGAEDMLSR